MNLESTHIVNFQSLIKDLVNSNLDIRLPSRGESMFPQIQGGDILRISPFELGLLSKGSIIAFQSGTSVVCHRVINFYHKEKCLFCQTKGDTHIYPDEVFPAEKILGVVKEIERSRNTPYRKFLTFISNVLLRLGNTHAFFFIFYLSLKRSAAQKIATYFKASKTPVDQIKN